MDVDKMKPKLLYVEDFRKCYEITQGVFGEYYDIDWRKNFIEGAMSMNNLEQYCAGVFDINLNYDSSKADSEQTKEGLDLIEVVRERGSSLPIICASKDNYKNEAFFYCIFPAFRIFPVICTGEGIASTFRNGLQ